MSLVHWPQGDSSVPRETDGATASAQQGSAKGPGTRSETEKGMLPPLR